MWGITAWRDYAKFIMLTYSSSKILFMYLHYDVAPAFLNGQRFPIDRPVASEKEADAFVQHARKQRNHYLKAYCLFIIELWIFPKERMIQNS
jgi:hypothetical protein